MRNHFLFFAGEFTVSQPAVFRLDNWSHTMTPQPLIWENGILRRKNIFNENIKGCIYFCRTDDYNLELENLRLLSRLNIKCWPDLNKLLQFSSRHYTLNYLANWQLRQLDYAQGEYGELKKFLAKEFKIEKYVLKTGEAHQGQDKFLLDIKKDTLPKFDGIATLEPFYEGKSVRILWIGGKHFSIQYDNPNSWIKNSSGAEVSSWNAPQNIIEHSYKVKQAIGLDVAGIDYIFDEKTNEFFCLEFNQYPGLSGTNESAAWADEYLTMQMKLIAASIR